MVVTYHGDWCGVDMGWRRDGENLRKAQKRFVWAAVTGAESRELGSERARRAWRLRQEVFLHHVIYLLSHPISRIEPGIEELG